MRRFSRIRQHLVGGAHLGEALLRRRVRVDVGVQLAGELAVRPLDLVGSGVAADAQDPVVVACHPCVPHGPSQFVEACDRCQRPARISPT